MGDRTGIEWTDATWNPVTGCDRVSPGCDHCYALTLAKRLKAMGVAAYQTDGDPRTSGPGFGVQCHPHMLDQPLRWTRPRRIFVNSMSDLFHKDVPTAFIAKVFAVMACSPQHTFQILTKRPQRMATLLNDEPGSAGDGSWILASTFTTLVHEEIALLGHPEACYDRWPLPNVWVGVSIEYDVWAWRADHLRATQAAVRFISAEPLLGPLPSLDLTGIDWLIVGGESGHGARPMHPDWARDLRDRCTSSSAEMALMQVDPDQPVPSSPDSGESRSRAVRPEWESAQPRATGAPPPEASSYAGERSSRPAFHFKQWGEWAPIYGYGVEFGRWVDPVDGGTYSTTGEGRVVMSRFGKKSAGRMLDGRTWDEFPTVVTA